MTYCGKAKIFKYVIKKFIIDNLILCQARQVTEVGQNTKVSQVAQARQVTEVGQDSQQPDSRNPRHTSKPSTPSPASSTPSN